MKYPWYGVEDEEERLRLLKEYAREHFGEADEETKAFRKRCTELGAPIVFVSSGLSNADTMEILEGKDTQRIINDPESWKF